MAFDEGLAEILRDDLAERPGIQEKRMVDGMVFMLDGHMLCGVTAGGTMFRVGKANEPEAIAVPGTTPMAFTGRPMSGIVEVDDDCLADDPRRARLMALALGFVAGLPPK